jgi:tetratricopeptide (TPR) repeat protein
VLTAPLGSERKVDLAFATGRQARTTIVQRLFMDLSQENQIREDNAEGAAISSDLCRTCPSRSRCEPKTHVDLGVCALEEGRLQEAEAAFEKACALKGDCFRAACGLADIYQQSADFPRAFQAYLKCLDLDGTSLPALLGLFQSSLAGGSLAAVRQYLELNLEVTPGDTAIMFCLASLYLRQNRLEDAKKVLIDLLILDPAYRHAALKRWNIRWLNETAVRNQVTGR